jgi:hypothetical protein
MEFLFILLTYFQYNLDLTVWNRNPYSPAKKYVKKHSIQDKAFNIKKKIKIIHSSESEGEEVSDSDKGSYPESIESSELTEISLLGLILFLID